MDVYSSINLTQTNQKKSTRAKKLDALHQDDRSDRREEKEKVNNYTHLYHTITTERKFFDQVQQIFFTAFPSFFYSFFLLLLKVRDLLTNSSRDAWTEFVKCLDLFSRDALSKKEVLLLAQVMPTSKYLLPFLSSYINCCY